MDESHDAEAGASRGAGFSRRTMMRAAVAGATLAAFGGLAGGSRAAVAQERREGDEGDEHDILDQDGFDPDSSEPEEFAQEAPEGFNYPFTDETVPGPVPYIDMDDLFGNTRWPRVRPHSGIDFKAPGIDGRSIRSIARGTVIGVDTGGGSFGHHVQVEHPSGHVSLYAHMKQGTIGVGVGQVVAAGAHLGGVGSTGESTGPHLHLTIYPHRGTSTPIDPLHFVLGAPFANRINIPGEDTRLTRGFAVYANSATNAWVIGGPGTWRLVPQGKGDLYQSIYGERVALSAGDFADVAVTCLESRYGDVRVYANSATNEWVLAGPAVWYPLDGSSAGFFTAQFGERIAVSDGQFKALRAAFAK